MADEIPKQVVTQTVTPVTQTDSPTEVEAQDSVDFETVEQELSYNLVEDSNLDWPVLEEVKEISEEQAEQVQAEATEQPQQEQPQQEAPVSEEEQPKQEAKEDSLTDGMRERISKLKQGETEKLAEKDAQIRQRDSQIKELQEMNEKFTTLTQSFRPATGDPKQIEDEIQSLENRLDEDGDQMTAAEIHKLGRRQQQLEKQLDDIKSSEIHTQNLIQQQKQMRNQYDSYATDNYSFINKPQDEKYTVMKEEAYPLLEQLIPNFKQYPHDMVIAAELSDLMVDAQKYRKLIGDQPDPKRAEPQPMASNVAPSAQATQPKKNFGQEFQRVRGGSLEDIAKVLRQAGHGWSAPK